MEKKEMDRYRCLKETCGRLGKLFGEIAEALQGVASMEQATAPLAKVTEEDMLRNCISMLMQEREHAVVIWYLPSASGRPSIASWPTMALVLPMATMRASSGWHGASSPPAAACRSH